MGCGASKQSKSSSPLVTGAGQTAVNQEARSQKPSPIAEDVKAVQEQEPKEAGQPAGGATPKALPASAPTTNPSDVEPPETTKPPIELPVTDGAVGGPALPADGEPFSQHPQHQPRLVLGASTSDIDGQPPGTPSLGALALDPAVTPTSQTATVTLMPEAAGFLARSRYTNESDLSMASTNYDLSGRGEDSDDDDELAALFTLQAWKRYYGYNKKKAQDLLTYFWRKFPAQDYSLFCVSYRNQDLLITQYMAENCVNGYCARLEDGGLTESLFVRMCVLQNPETDQFRIVGLLLVPGQALPGPLTNLAAFDGFVYHRADPGVSLVRQFVSALLVGVSPLNSLQLLTAREVV